MRQLFWIIFVLALAVACTVLVGFNLSSQSKTDIFVTMTVILFGSSVALFVLLLPFWDRLQHVEEQYDKHFHFAESFIRKIATHEMVEAHLRRLALEVAECSCTIKDFRDRGFDVSLPENFASVVHCSQQAFEAFEKDRKHASVAYGTYPTWKQYLHKEFGDSFTYKGVTISLKLSATEKRRLENPFVPAQLETH